MAFWLGNTSTFRNLGTTDLVSLTVEVFLSTSLSCWFSLFSSWQVTALLILLEHWHQTWALLPAPPVHCRLNEKQHTTWVLSANVHGCQCYPSHCFCMLILIFFSILTLTTLDVGVQSWGEEVPIWAAVDVLSTFPTSFSSRSLNKLFNYTYGKIQYILIMTFVVILNKTKAGHTSSPMSRMYSSTVVLWAKC